MKIRLIVIATLIALSALYIMPTSAHADSPSTNKAVVTFTPSSDTSPFCVDPSLFFLVADHTAISTSTTFTLKIDLLQNLCSPKTGKAVIYAMPGNGEAWPQTLVSVVPFSMQQRGTYYVTFTKLCSDQQFDIIGGQQFDVLDGNSDTPEVISPDGAHHGPLLFPLDENSALQWFGAVCATTTTTTAPTTSTTTSTTTTTVPQSSSTSTSTTTTSLPVETEPTTSTTSTSTTSTSTTVPETTIPPVSTSVEGTVVTTDPGITTTTSGNTTTSTTVPDVTVSGVVVDRCNDMPTTTSTTTTSTTEPDFDEEIKAVQAQAVVTPTTSCPDPTTTDPQVKGISVANNTLPTTGSETKTILAAGIILLGAGSALVVARRRKAMMS